MRVWTLSRLLPLILGLSLAAAGGADGATASPGTGNVSDGTADKAVITGDSGPIAEHFASLTRDLARDMVAEFTLAMQALDPRGKAIDWAAIGAATLELALVVAPTLVLFALLRWLEGLLLRRLQNWCALGSAFVRLGRRCMACVGRIITDFAGILIAWVGGYAVALFVVGESGTMVNGQSLFLNAFLGLEVVKAALRLLLAPGHAGLRVLPLGDEDASYWNAWLARLVTCVGYGLLLVVPIVNEAISPALGSVIGFLVLAGGLFFGITIIWQNRVGVRNRLLQLAEVSEVAFNRFALSLLARVWHLLAIAYLAVLAVVIQTRPQDALSFMGQATLQTVIVLVIGLGLYYGLSQVLGRRICVPDNTRARFPDLEERLNLFVTPGVQVLRVAVLGVIALGLIDAWQLIDLTQWLVSSAGMQVLARLVSLLFIVIVASAFWIFAASWIDARLQLDASGGGDISARKRTLLSLFRSTLAIVLAMVTAMVVLSEIGINIAPLLAGAGVLGLAVGFGAQKLVQDIITGVFIQLENAMNTGDWVTVGGISGTVERLSIRSVGIRDLEGAFHIIPFSFVDTVSNYMREFAYHLGVYSVAYREDTDRVIEQLRTAFTDLEQDPNVAPYILSELHVDGISALADSSVNIRIRIKTIAGMQWFVGRAYNRLVKKHFDAAGVEIALPHQKVYFGHGTDGYSQPLAVRMISDEGAASADEADSGQAGQPPPEPGTDPAHAGEDELPAEFGDVERSEDPRKAPDDDSDLTADSGAEDDRQR